MTQGYEANHSGKFLEALVRSEFSKRGFVVRPWESDGDNLDMFTSKVIVCNVPYRSLYGGMSRSEFVITDGSRRVRVECRWQECNGSVDEKFVCLLRNAVECMPEPEVLILFGGNGARDGAISWLKREAKRVQTKRIHVVNINDFPQWVRAEFIHTRKIVHEALQLHQTRSDQRENPEA